MKGAVDLTVKNANGELYPDAQILEEAQKISAKLPGYRVFYEKPNSNLTQQTNYKFQDGKPYGRPDPQNRTKDSKVIGYQADAPHIHIQPPDSDTPPEAPSPQAPKPSAPKPPTPASTEEPKPPRKWFVG